MKLGEFRVLDVQVATLVMMWEDTGKGWWVDSGGNYQERVDYGLEAFLPSRHIECAWKVVERMRKDGLSMTMVLGVNGSHYCRFEKGAMLFDALEPTAPLAICKAALLSVTARTVAT